MWNKLIVTPFEIPYEHLPGMTEKNQNKPQVSWSICRQMNPVTPKYEVKTVAHSMQRPVI
jgi:hypothetical protein